MSGLIELAERCEAATGPDRELDAEIGYAIDWGNDRYTVRFLHDDARNSFGDIGAFWDDLPHFTASLDAAMTLVPEGCGHAIWAVLGKRPCSSIQFPSIEGLPTFTASVDGWSNWYGGETPALALTAAALRARAAQEGDA